MIKVLENELEIRIRTNNPQGVQDTIYGLIWHRLNNHIKENKSFKEMETEYDIMKAISPDCEMLTKAKTKKLSVVGK